MKGLKLTLNRLENDERVDEFVRGGDEEICSSNNDVEEFCLCME
jgi:hypothetical protein